MCSNATETDKLPLRKANITPICHGKVQDNFSHFLQHIDDSLAALRNTFEQIHRGVADQRDKRLSLFYAIAKPAIALFL
ncbi:hypothetical protein F444_00094 [Phytophthora nicotianae P1976]|uniref:Uncharacterized protein n=1 Tax=Phytophthora nicotianae P1976 TaxID=1317066 RepID=A0A081B5E8_PHYNI|nr:hypothetical protein F444_00094 [Phytophthora nicotianae P1976]